MSTPMTLDTDVREIIAIVNVRTASGPGFATTEQSEKVYIPAAVMRSADLLPGDKIRVRVVENFEDRRSEVRWRTIYAAKVSTPAPADVGSQLETRRLSDLLVAAERLLFDDEIDEPDYAWSVVSLHTYLRTGAFEKITLDARGDKEVEELSGWIVEQIRRGRLHHAKIINADATVPPKLYFSVDASLLEPWGVEDDSDANAD